MKYQINMYLNKISGFIKKLVLSFNYDIIAVIFRSKRGFEARVEGDVGDNTSLLTNAVFFDIKKALAENNNFWVESNIIINKKEIDSYDIGKDKEPFVRIKGYRNLIQIPKTLYEKMEKEKAQKIHTPKTPQEMIP